MAAQPIKIVFELDEHDTDLWLARLRGSALRIAQNAGVIDAVGVKHVFPSLRDAEDYWRAGHEGEMRPWRPTPPLPKTLDRTVDDESGE